VTASPREALARRTGPCPLCAAQIRRGDGIRQTRVGWCHSSCAQSYEVLMRENAEADR
jgi:hypothetical protein